MTNPIRVAYSEPSRFAHLSITLSHESDSLVASGLLDTGSTFFPIQLVFSLDLRGTNRRRRFT
jgi:hypothetical protein